MSPREIDDSEDWGDGAAALWQSARALADSWRQLPSIQSFAAHLPRNVRTPSGDIAGHLQEIHAGDSSTGHISAHPLRARVIIQLFQQLPMFGQTPIGWEAWVRNAEIIEMAHKYMMGWLRSRMPGYPNLPAPQLAAGTYLTTLQYTDRVTWSREERGFGYQFSDVPQAICLLLQTSGAQARSLAGATRELVTELSKSPQWIALAEARGRLRPSEITELSAARKKIASQLTDEKVAAHSTRLFDIFNFRVKVLEEVLDTLSPDCARYAYAFKRANDFLDLVASDAFGQLVAYGTPNGERSPQSVDFRPGSTQLINFTRANTNAHFFDRLELGQLVHIETPLGTEVVRLLGSTQSFSHRGHVERWTGLLLPGAFDAWAS